MWTCSYGNSRSQISDVVTISVVFISTDMAQCSHTCFVMVPETVLSASCKATWAKLVCCYTCSHERKPVAAGSVKTKVVCSPSWTEVRNPEASTSVQAMGTVPD